MGKLAAQLEDPGGSARVGRLLKLLDLLHTHGEVATRDLVVLLDSDRKKVMRDVRTLREAGVPVYWVGRGRNRRHRLAPYYRRAAGGRDEALALALGRTLLRRSAQDRSTPDGYTPTLVHGTGARAMAENEDIHALIDAIATGQRCLVDSGDGASLLAPQGIVSLGGHLLLVAQDIARGHRQLVCLDRVPVHIVGPVSETSTVARDLAAAVNEALGSEEDPAESHAIVLEFASSVVGIARALDWEESAVWEDLGDGRWQVRTHMTALDALDRVLGVGGGVTVQSPAWFESAARLAEHGRTHFK